MSGAVHGFISLDLFPLLAGTLAALSCGLLGNFLVLRRLSLMGDAISHSVLPGLVIAFLVAGTRNSLPMFAGAAIAGIATVVLVEVVKKLGRVEPGAAMGVVFSVLFALGVLLIEQAAARSVDLDADCVLHGQLETLFWFPPADWGALLSVETLREVPRQVTTLAAMLAASVAFVAIFFKELRLAAFDPSLATAQGFNATAMHYALMVLVAAATVASFEAVGSILVIAMLICPAATARLVTDRLLPQILASAAFAVIAGVGGYFAATWIPERLGHDAVNAAGSMTLVAGALVAAAAVLSPRHGVLARVVRRRRMGRDVAMEDLLAALHRLAEGGEADPSDRRLAEVMPRRSVRGLAAAAARGLVERSDGTVSLTPSGRDAAADVIRRHRLWESYLVDEAGLAADHVHDTAAQLEHLRLRPPADAATDPHGRDIPPPPGPAE